MRRLIVAIALVGLLACGCTAPTQRIAERAMGVAMHYDATIVDDLSTLAKQQALDASAKDVETAFQDKNVDRAKLAVTNLANTWESVSFLQIQNERKRALFRIGQQFIFEQRGFLDVMVEELGQAKQNVDNQPAPTPVPTPAPASAPAAAKAKQNTDTLQSLIDELNSVKAKPAPTPAKPTK